MSAIGKELGEILLDNGLLNQEAWQSVKEEYEQTGDSLKSILSRRGLVTESQLKDTLELQYGVNYYSLSRALPDKNVQDELPQSIIKQYKVIPVARQGNTISVAMVNPEDEQALSAVRSHLKDRQLKPMVCTEDDVVAFLEHLKKEAAMANENDNAEQQQINKPAPADVLTPIQAVAVQAPAAVPNHSATITTEATSPTNAAPAAAAAVVDPAPAPVSAPVSALAPAAESAPAAHHPSPDAPSPVPTETADSRLKGIDSHSLFGDDDDEFADFENNSIEESQDPDFIDVPESADSTALMLLANNLIARAIEKRCSDMHVEPEETIVQVRYLKTQEIICQSKLPKRAHSELVFCYKVIAGLDIIEQSRPQDRKSRITIAGEDIELRVTTIPGDDGETVAITFKYPAAPS